MKKQTTPADRSPIFPLPFTRDQLQKDILNIVLNEVRKISQITGLETAVFGLTGINSALFDAGCSPEDIGISYEQIKNFHVAQALEDYFDYGLFAVSPTRSENLEYDSIHTWLIAFLVDLDKSLYASEWGEGEGQEGLMEGIRRCFYLCELVNARVILEGGEPLFNHFSRYGKDDGGNFHELSIKGLAMLAGMEEMSLRSAISRKTVPILEIRKDDRRTYIDLQTAKNWLIAKGRYQSVYEVRTSADLDLATTSFGNTASFLSMLTDRFGFISDKATDEIKVFLKEAHLTEYLFLSHADLCNSDLMEKIAKWLELPADLLKMRAREAVLRDEIIIRESQLEQLQLPRHTVGSGI